MGAITKWRHTKSLKRHWLIPKSTTQKRTNNGFRDTKKNPKKSKIFKSAVSQRLIVQAYLKTIAICGQWHIMLLRFWLWQCIRSLKHVCGTIFHGLISHKTKNKTNFYRNSTSINNYIIIPPANGQETNRGGEERHISDCRNISSKSFICHVEARLQ